MKVFRKIVMLSLVALLFVFTAACDLGRHQGGDETVDGEFYPDDKEWNILEAKHDAQVDITMWIPNSATSTMGTSIQALADAFNAEQVQKHGNKNIKVTVEFQGTSGALNTKLQASILAGDNPVISAIGVSSVPLYGDRAVDLRNVFTYAELQAQQQGLFQYSLYNDKFMLNPYFPSASNILVVNKTMFAGKGVTMPTPESIISDPDASDWTWDKFKTMAAAVTEKDKGIYGFAAGSLDPVGLMYQQGGSLYNRTVTGIEFDKDDKFKTGLQFWRSLVTEDLMINPTGRANHGTIIVSEFYEKKVGMIFTTSSNLVKFTTEAKAADFEITVLPFPKSTQFFTNQGGSGNIIFNNKPAAEQEAAAEFLRWLNKPSSISKMCAGSGYLPLDERAMDEAELKAVYASTPLLKTTAELMKFGVKASQGKAKAAADSAVNNYAKKIWSEPNTSIDSIIAEITEKVKFEIESIV